MLLTQSGPTNLITHPMRTGMLTARASRIKISPVEKLNNAFAIGDALTFREMAPGMICARIETETCSAEVCLQGAHITHWQPEGAMPVLFTSAQNRYVAGEPIHGGIPVIFPWFGLYRRTRKEGVKYPLHGFARTQNWQVRSAALRNGVIEMVFLLKASDASRRVGFDCFRVEYTVRFGRELALEMRVENRGFETLTMEEALHPHFAVHNVRQTAVEGLENAEYLDRTNPSACKVQKQAAIGFSGRTDSVYIDTAAACIVRDEVDGRRIQITKEGSDSTLVWNPGEESDADTSGFTSKEWNRHVGLGVANAHTNTRYLQASGAQHTMKARISLLPE